ncbi:unnamed protein product [Closterium sp. Naga37s-1]|nr:unnamed protein product [Closterium sp. Naga37s-1]
MTRRGNSSPHARQPFSPLHCSPSFTALSSPSVCLLSLRASPFTLSPPPTAALVVYDTQGKQLTRIIPQNEFFGALPDYVDRRDPLEASVMGDNIGGLTCTYDRKARRFYLTAVWLSGQFNNTFDKAGLTRRRGDITVGAGLIVAASTTADPTKPLPWHAFTTHANRPLPSPPHLLPSPPIPSHRFLPLLSLLPSDPYTLLPPPPFASLPPPSLSSSPSSLPVFPSLLTSLPVSSHTICENPPVLFPSPPVPVRPLPSPSVHSLTFPYPPSSVPSHPFPYPQEFPSPTLSPPHPLIPAPPLSPPHPPYPRRSWGGRRTLPFFDSATSKAQLQRAENANILRFVVPASPTPTNPSWTILPQKVAADGSYDYSHGGTMYFAYTGSTNHGAPNETILFPNVTAMGAFALTGTMALGTSDAENRVEPHCAAVYTSPHVLPHAATQKKGPVPIAWKMGSGIAPIGLAGVDASAVVVDPARRQMWVSFMSAAGKELSATAVVVRLRLSLRPQRKSHTFRVFLERFKAVGVEGNSLLQPTMALNSRGEGILAASLAGPKFYPSAAYARINANTDVGRVVVAGPGKAPLDDYLSKSQPGLRMLTPPLPIAAYRFNVPVLLYGFFMSATIDEDGNAWAAVEYVGGVERTDYSNWGTYIFKVDLGEKKGGGGVEGG